MIEMPSDYERIHDPERQEHYVYRLIGRRKKVLYIGCSMNLPLRLSEHRRNARFAHLIVDVEKYGPYSYQEGRATEAAWIRMIEPPFNIEHTRRHQRGVALYRQGRVA